MSIIGPSGCGKSTFMRCLNLLGKPTSGRILIEGEDVLDKKADETKLIFSSELIDGGLFDRAEKMTADIVKKSTKSINCENGRLSVTL